MAWALEGPAVMPAAWAKANTSASDGGAAEAGAMEVEGAEGVASRLRWNGVGVGWTDGAVATGVGVGVKPAWAWA